MGRYAISVDEFFVFQTRAPFNDSDIVSIGPAVVDGKTVAPAKTLDVGNVSKDQPPHLVALGIGPVDVGPDQTLTVPYQILNNGYDRDDADAAKKVLDGLIDGGAPASFGRVWVQFRVECARPRSQVVGGFAVC